MKIKYVCLMESEVSLTLCSVLFSLPEIWENVSIYVFLFTVVFHKRMGIKGLLRVDFIE